ncbi:MAG: hypothetical protein Q9182_007482 [Xanthomendoza sp. 2 TL-2023]
MPHFVKSSDFWLFHAHRLLDDKREPGAKTRSDYPTDLRTQKTIKILADTMQVPDSSRRSWSHKAHYEKNKAGLTLSLRRPALFQNAIPKPDMLRGMSFAASHQASYTIGTNLLSSTIDRPVNPTVIDDIVAAPSTRDKARTAIQAGSDDDQRIKRLFMQPTRLVEYQAGSTSKEEESLFGALPPLDPTPPPGSPGPAQQPAF